MIFVRRIGFVVAKLRREAHPSAHARNNGDSFVVIVTGFFFTPTIHPGTKKTEAKRNKQPYDVGYSHSRLK